MAVATVRLLPHALTRHPPHLIVVHVGHLLYPRHWWLAACLAGCVSALLALDMALCVFLQQLLHRHNTHKNT